MRVAFGVAMLTPESMGKRSSHCDKSNEKRMIASSGVTWRCGHDLGEFRREVSAEAQRADHGISQFGAHLLNGKARAAMALDLRKLACPGTGMAVLCKARYFNTPEGPEEWISGRSSTMLSEDSHFGRCRASVLEARECSNWISQTIHRYHHYILLAPPVAQNPSLNLPVPVQHIIKSSRTHTDRPLLPPRLNVNKILSTRILSQHKIIHRKPCTVTEDGPIARPIR
ncbi:uncharacterized protein BDR25DRAFT_359872 [Lindgomyces ingoldianus]|uniref:Uncharacterized protein n=1 Tax=Lindgomyces ingoldianus TaxID=673940 RepID=A0ACB6QIW7_9PLEO|nr:uncharacterized protein BDR25DRAFT_359872 [Lindgomyces ingoldianus]KAF2466086.1 hypothetical protein BDR25DRAFT_359872 [Lindgomyces ingoldianus]